MFGDHRSLVTRAGGVRRTGLPAKPDASDLCDAARPQRELFHARNQIQRYDSVLHEFDMGAEFGLQFADPGCPHRSILAQDDQVGHVF